MARRYQMFSIGLIILGLIVQMSGYYPFSLWQIPGWSEFQGQVGVGGSFSSTQSFTLDGANYVVTHSLSFDNAYSILAVSRNSLTIGSTSWPNNGYLTYTSSSLDSLTFIGAQCVSAQGTTYCSYAVDHNPTPQSCTVPSGSYGSTRTASCYIGGVLCGQIRYTCVSATTSGGWGTAPGDQCQPTSSCPSTGIVGAGYCGNPTGSVGATQCINGVQYTCAGSQPYWQDTGVSCNANPRIPTNNTNQIVCPVGTVYNPTTKVCAIPPTYPNVNPLSVAMVGLGIGTYILGRRIKWLR